MYDPQDPEWKHWVHVMRQHRGDDTPRWAFADWIEERYGPLGLEGLIRGGIDLWNAQPGTYLTERGCLDGPLPHPAMKGWSGYLRAASGHKRFWGCQQSFFGSLPDDVRKRWRWARGFPEKVVCSSDHWVEWGDTICSLGPVGEVEFTDVPGVYANWGEQFYRVSPRNRDLWLRLGTRQSWLMRANEWEKMVDGARQAHVDMIRLKFFEAIWGEPVHAQPVESFALPANRRQPWTL